MSLSYLPASLTIVGAMVALAAAFVRGRLLAAAATIGWMGILATAFFVQFGARVGATVAPVPAALAMAGSAALVVAPVASSMRIVRQVGAAIPGLVAAAGGAASLVYLTAYGTAPWPQGALLIGAHWSALGAAVAAALIGPGLNLAAWWRDRREAGGAESRSLRAYGRDFTARSVAFVWLAWALAILVHWRFLGAPGIGARSEWFGLGVTLLATGGLLFGWSLEDAPAAKIRGTCVSLWVAAVLIAGIWLSFGFGSPLQLALGA